MSEPTRRSAMTAGEVARVCAQFDLGSIHAVRGLRAGSRAAPKALLSASRGTFLLKRRAAGAADPLRVALSHEVQIRLRSAGFPAPALVGTASNGNTIVQLDGAVYEMFQFVDGVEFDGTPGQIRAAGAALAEFHAVLDGYAPTWPIPAGSFHDQANFGRAIESVQRRLESTLQRSERASMHAASQSLLESWRRAHAVVERAGYGEWQRQVVHADWHPGNLLFEPPRANESGGGVAAVLDFDAVRLAPKQTDLANGLLQFSIRRLQATEHGLNAGAAEAFLRGYSAVGALGKNDVEPVLSLMIEAIAVEAVAPILATGRFGRLAAAPVLIMVAAKCRWLEDHGKTWLDGVRRALTAPSQRSL